MMAEVGYTLMHEHTTIDLSGVKQDADCRLDCHDETVREYRRLYELGVRTIVDVTNKGMDPNPGDHFLLCTEIDSRTEDNHIDLARLAFYNREGEDITGLYDLSGGGL